MCRQSHKILEDILLCTEHELNQTSQRKRQHLKSPRSVTASSVSRSHNGCVLHQAMLSIPVPFIPWQSSLLFLRYNSTLKIQGQRSRSKVLQSSWLISLVFYIRASYRLPSLSFHDNRDSHSRDTIWLWKFKVKGTPVSAASSWLISIVFHIRASYRLLSLSFHDNWASHSRDTIWPWKFKVKGQGQGQWHPSQCIIQVIHFLFVSHQLDQPFLRYGKWKVQPGKMDLKFYEKNR